MPEHHFGLFGCLPAPATFLAHVAARTSRIRLAAATVVLPCAHPIHVAEEWALLDLLSNGRTVFCAGRGYDRREYDTFEVPFEESRGRFDEEMAIVRELVRRHGGTVTLTDADPADADQPGLRVEVRLPLHSQAGPPA